MTINNTFYTVTPPDLVLPTTGPSVLFLGTDLAGIRPYAEMYDRLFPETPVTFFVRENGNDINTTAWYRAVSSFVSLVIVDLTNITHEELFIATQVMADDNAMVFWVDQHSAENPMIPLLNSWHHRVFTSLNDIEKYLFNED